MNVIPDYSKAAAFIENFEGYRAEAYLDSGKVWTIGYGSTYNWDKKRKVLSIDIISRQTAQAWLEIECKTIENYLNLYIKVKLNENQSTALVDYVYNRGIGNFLKTNLDELTNLDPLDPRIEKEILGTGLKDRLGNLLWGLGRRRRAEAHLYKYGEMQFVWKKWG